MATEHKKGIMGFLNAPYLILGIIVSMLAIYIIIDTEYKKKETVKKHFENSDVYLGTDDYNNAIIELDATLKEIVKKHFENSDVYLRTYDYNNAIIEFDAILKIESDNISALIGRGKAYTNIKDNDKAIADFDAVLKIEPDNTSALIGRGKAYTNIKDNDKAIADFDAVLKIEPDNVEALTYKNGIYFKYRSIRIGNQTWMAENLNDKIGNSWCYENKEANCKKYGRLYDWNTAKKACPNGWHLPSREEWGTLVRYAGGSSIAGKKLKAKSSWNDNGNSTDDYGFLALPSGYRKSDGSFNNAGSYGPWWTATKIGNYAYRRSMNSGVETVYDSANKINNAYAVRCVKN